jgi:hypothetical protein
MKYFEKKYPVVGILEDEYRDRDNFPLPSGDDADVQPEGCVVM